MEMYVFICWVKKTNFHRLTFLYPLRPSLPLVSSASPSINTFEFTFGINKFPKHFTCQAFFFPLR